MPPLSSRIPRRCQSGVLLTAMLLVAFGCGDNSGGPAAPPPPSTPPTLTESYEGKTPPGLAGGKQVTTKRGVVSGGKSPIKGSAAAGPE